jgi:hypothetical protein
MVIILSNLVVFQLSVFETIIHVEGSAITLVGCLTVIYHTRLTKEGTVQPTEGGKVG